MSLGDFFRATFHQAVSPRWRGLGMVVFVLLTATNALLALHAPLPGASPDAMFTGAAVVRGIGAVMLGVALLRAATASPRPRWMPDAGFFLYLAISVIGFGFSAAATRAGIALPVGVRILVVEMSGLMLFGLFARWMVAAAVEVPLALSPSPWFRALGAWFPQYLAVAAPLVLLAAAHAWLSLQLLALPGSNLFWPAALFDGLLSTMLVLLVQGLRVTAYRAVAPT